MKEQPSARAEGYLKDFSMRFGAGGGSEQAEWKDPVDCGEFEEIELRLGLSLGGRFGMEPKDNKLVRFCSTSIFPREREFPLVPPLDRMCSLKAEVDEGRRKRKELQSLNRLDAKRSRSEKKSSKSGIVNQNDEVMKSNEVTSLGLSPWAETIEATKRFELASQAPVGSQGSMCSSLSDNESQPNTVIFGRGLNDSGLHNSPKAEGFGYPFTGTLAPEQIISMALANYAAIGCLRGR